MMAQPMHAMIIDRFSWIALAAALAGLSLCGSAFAQDGKRGVPKPVTVPISLRFKEASSAEMREVVLLVREDGDVQQMVSQRSALDSPMTLAPPRRPCCAPAPPCLRRRSKRTARRTLANT